ncbi:hypothetical protein QLQ12_14530 [Actinoplanes sp. NEAU-A12]|uniref:Uncharacterized protein n=1 Tax=Actinoplanes sandaracinus TaxID=3045177 RepID=A0ABT6WJI4_9ACTN|nr:hypothetical protein [Actinoplanes sandaracinus]MDI6099815.1 hypothetical protein [Actinoplanes sandaracinus]
MDGAARSTGSSATVGSVGGDGSAAADPPAGAVVEPVTGPPPPAPPLSGIRATGGGTGGTGGTGVPEPGPGSGSLVTVADSTGLVTVGLTDVFGGDGLGLGDLEGLVEAFGEGERAGRRWSVPSRCADSTIRRAALVVGVGVGVGVGTGSVFGSSESSSSPGRGNTALELTGPPARLTLTSPP